jgi:hypothetical protein
MSKKHSKIIMMGREILLDLISQSHLVLKRVAQTHMLLNLLNIYRLIKLKRKEVVQIDIDRILHHCHVKILYLE